MATASVGNEHTNPDKQPSVFCETCEYKRTTKYCINCELSFCVTCIRVHQKMKGSQDHVVREISEPESTHEGKQLEPQLPCCFDHPGNVYKLFCTDCTCLICVRCKPAHYGHSQEAIAKDFEFYRNVCRKNTQRLLDTTHELEDYKSLLDRNVKNCNEAIANVEKWESELVTLIQECAKKLKEALTKKKVDHQSQTAKQQSNVDDVLSEIDDQIAHLNIRKLDEQAIAHETAASQSLLSRAKNVIKRLAPQPKVISVSDLLQRSSELEDLTNRIEQFFEMCDTPRSIVVNRLSEFYIPNPKCYSEDGYKICKPSVPERVIMHGSSMANLRILNTVNKKIIEAKSDRHIWNMIALSSKKYVSIHGYMKKLFLLTNNFQSVYTEESRFYFDSLFPTASDHFLVYEIKDIKDTLSSQGFLKLMKAKDNCLFCERTYNIDLNASKCTTRMAMFRDNRHALVCSENTLCKIDLISGVFQKYDLSLCAKSMVHAKCMCTDSKDNVLVGCTCGTIHLFDKDFKTHRELLKVGGNPNDMDIEVVGNRLFVSRRSKVEEYSYY